jgi:hypothetical protein
VNYDPNATKTELDQLAAEIQDATDRADYERQARMQSVYLDVVDRKRQMTPIEMHDFVVDYLRMPRTGTYPAVGRNWDDFPSLMEVSGGKEELAAMHVVWLMKQADIDGITLNLRRACEEAERAAANFIHLNGDERLRDR